jgi:Transposase DNA-binding
MFDKYAELLAPHLLLGDTRLSARCVSMLGHMGNNFGHSIPNSFPDFKGAKAAYDFLRNPRVEPYMLHLAERDRLKSQFESERPKIVLAVQDTTELDLTNKRAHDKLGCMSYEHQRGFLVHNHCLFTPQGIALGVFDQKIWNRPVELLGVDKKKGRPIEEKESFRWVEQFELLQDCFESCPDTTFVEICDQESDIQEFFQARRLNHVHYICRSRGDRKAVGSPCTIRQELLAQPVQGCYTIMIERAPGRDPRKAKLLVRFMELTVNATRQHNRDLQAVTIGLVLVTELDPPLGAEPVDWLLSTSLPLHGLADAFQVVNWYGSRWGIEMFHYALKQGCLVEKLQLETENGLQTAIVLYSFLAMQVVALRYCAQHMPEANMEITGFEKTDYKAAAIYLNAKNGSNYDPEIEKPSVGDFATVVADLGGSMLQKNRPHGIKALWRGVRDLHIVRCAYNAFCPKNGQHDTNIEIQQAKTDTS